MAASRDKFDAKWAWGLAAAGLIVAGLATLLIAVGPGEEKSGSGKSGGEFAAYDDPPGGGASERTSGGMSTDAGTTRDRDVSRARGVVLEHRIAESDSPDGGLSRSARLGDASGGWNGRVNSEVLGPKRWMAKLPEEKQESIREDLDRERPDRYPIALETRQQGIDRAKPVVRDCYRKLQQRRPGAEGRIIVAFDVVVSGGSARLENPDVPVNVKLDDASFESCITSGLRGMSFPAGDDGEMHVEYPFLFDLE